MHILHTKLCQETGKLQSGWLLHNLFSISGISELAEFASLVSPDIECLTDILVSCVEDTLGHNRYIFSYVSLK